MFRFQFPRPGNEKQHLEWRQWLQDNSIWPSESQLLDETYQMMMPGEWRRNPYKRLKTMDEFAEVQVKRIERCVTWNTRYQATR